MEVQGRVSGPQSHLHRRVCSCSPSCDRNVACIGAALSIVSLAFGFFSQQLIDTRIENIESQSPSDVGRVNRSTYISTVIPDVNCESHKFLVQAMRLGSD